MPNGSSPEKSTLAPVAKEVSIYLDKYFKEFREQRDELAGETVIQKANQIISALQEGKEVDKEELINFTLVLRGIKSKLLTEEQDQKGATIIDNFYKKLIRSIGIEDLDTV